MRPPYKVIERNCLTLYCLYLLIIFHIFGIIWKITLFLEIQTTLHLTWKKYYNRVSISYQYTKKGDRLTHAMSWTKILFYSGLLYLYDSGTRSYDFSCFYKEMALYITTFQVFCFGFESLFLMSRDNTILCRSCAW